MALVDTLIGVVRQAEGLAGKTLDKAQHILDAGHDTLRDADRMLTEVSERYSAAVVEVEKILSKYEKISKATSGGKAADMTKEELVNSLHGNYRVYADKREVLEKSPKSALVLIYNMLESAGVPKDGINPTEAPKPAQQGPVMDWSAFVDDVLKSDKFDKDKPPSNPWDNDDNPWGGPKGF